MPVIASTAIVLVAPPENPDPVGAVQVYLVPAGMRLPLPSVGVYANGTPLQTVRE